MQTQRLFEILYLLLQHRKATAKQLAERFEVSVRTIYRDLDTLTLAGIPIYTVKGKHGGIFLMEDYTLSKSVLTDEEQQQILSALQSMQITNKENTRSLLTKLSGMFKKEDHPWIAVDFSDWSSTDNHIFTTVKQAILSHHVVTFTYYATNMTKQQKCIEPLQLLFKGQAWYVVGYCRDKQAQRTYKLKRMRDLMIIDDTFQRTLQPIDTHYHAYQETLVEVTLLMDETLGYRIYEEFPHEQITETKDGYVLHTSLPQGEILYSILLSYGEHMQVLEPKQVKQHLIEKIKKLQNNYKTDI